MVNVTIVKEGREIAKESCDFSLSFFKTDKKQDDNNSRIVGMRSVSVGAMCPKDVYFLGKQLASFIVAASDAGGFPDHTFLLSKLTDGITSGLVDKEKERNYGKCNN